jgi:hypothetical protein
VSIKLQLCTVSGVNLSAPSIPLVIYAIIAEQSVAKLFAAGMIPGLVLTALYIPVVAMLVGLMLRGVAFEFRVKAQGWHRQLWNWLFWLGSFAASFFQGVMLGRYITGFAPGLNYWLFALVVAGGLCGGYVLLGATWLVHRTDFQSKYLPVTEFLRAVPGIELRKDGTVVVNEKHQTGNPKYFAGGDCTNGGKEVVDAVAEGMRAAGSLDAWLGCPRAAD